MWANLLHRNSPIWEIFEFLLTPKQFLEIFGWISKKKTHQFQTFLDAPNGALNLPLSQLHPCKNPWDNDSVSVLYYLCNEMYLTQNLQDLCSLYFRVKFVVKLSLRNSLLCKLVPWKKMGPATPGWKTHLDKDMCLQLSSMHLLKVLFSWVLIHFPPLFLRNIYSFCVMLTSPSNKPFAILGAQNEKALQP